MNSKALRGWAESFSNPDDRIVALALLDEFEQLQAQVEQLKDALGELRDWQNGPPLPSYTEHWTAAMKKANKLLAALEAGEG